MCSGSKHYFEKKKKKKKKKTKQKHQNKQTTESKFLKPARVILSWESQPRNNAEIDNL
jgi:hypothetical protein